jgi:hypothetical protein
MTPRPERCPLLQEEVPIIFPDVLILSEEKNHLPFQEAQPFDNEIFDPNIELSESSEDELEPVVEELQCFLEDQVPAPRSSPWLSYIIKSLLLKVSSNQSTCNFDSNMRLLKDFCFSPLDEHGSPRSLPSTFEMCFKSIGLKPSDKLGSWKSSFSCVSRCCILPMDSTHCPVCGMARSTQDICFWHRRFTFHFSFLSFSVFFP